MIDVTAVIVLALNAYFVKEHGRPGYCYALLAALLFAFALVLWWALVYPVNVQLTTWLNGPVPADWTRWRARWEWSHAAIAVTEFVGFALLVLSVLADTGQSPATASAARPRLRQPRRATGPKRRR
jgi:hypothetical protein